MNQTSRNQTSRKRAATHDQADETRNIYDSPAGDDFLTDSPHKVPNNRVAIHHRFYTRWNQDIDNVTLSVDDYSSISPYMPKLTWRDEKDSNFAWKWKRYFMDARDKASDFEASSSEKALHLDSTLRKALCYGDYMAELYDQMTQKQEESGRRIAELEAENRQLKRERQSMHERLREYEENIEQMMLKEEEMRRSKILEKSRIRPKQKPIDKIHDMHEGGTSPSVAELRKHFLDQGEPQLRPPKPPGVPLHDESRRPREIDPQRFKYVRRSKSVSRPVGILKKSNGNI